MYRYSRIVFWSAFLLLATAFAWGSFRHTERQSLDYHAEAEALRLPTYMEPSVIRLRELERDLVLRELRAAGFLTATDEQIEATLTPLSR